jgi:hypothetical protein
MAGQLLAGQGHAVTLHARYASRADDARAALPGAEGVVVGDLSTLAGMWGGSARCTRWATEAGLAVKNVEDQRTGPVPGRRVPSRARVGAEPAVPRHPSRRCRRRARRRR